MIRHKVFTSFHHGNPAIDPYCGQKYKERFESIFHNYYDTLISKSVQDGDINDGIASETIRQKIRDEFISDATVTIVLIGPETWKRKHVDWEISSSIRDTPKNPRCGLLGILLPTYTGSLTSYNPYTIPPRLYDNIKKGYAKIYRWTEDPGSINTWIHAAFLRRNTIVPDNSYPLFRNNRAEDQKQWSY